MKKLDDSSQNLPQHPAGPPVGYPMLFYGPNIDPNSVLPDFFQLATTCQDHQYSITFELLKSPILNELIQKLAAKLVHYFKNKVGTQTHYDINDYQCNQTLLQILSEMHKVLPSGNFGSRSILSPYRINFFRLIIHFVIGIYLFDDHNELPENFSKFNLADQQNSMRQNHLMVKFVQKYKINYFNLVLSGCWRMITMFNYYEKDQIFVLPGHFYFSVEDFKKEIDFLINDEKVLEIIKEPIRSWLKKELPSYRQFFLNFAAQIRDLNNFEVDLLIFIVGLKINRLNDAFFKANEDKKTSPNDWSNSNDSKTKKDQESKKMTQGMEGAVRFLCHCFSSNYSKIYQIADGFIKFNSQMCLFMPFLCAVKRPEECDDEKYRVIVYEISKEMVIEHPWMESAGVGNNKQ